MFYCGLLQMLIDNFCEKGGKNHDCMSVTNKLQSTTKNFRNHALVN